MPANSSARLGDVHPKTVKATLSGSAPHLERIKEAGSLVKTALVRSGVQQKVAASLMGLSDAQLSAQLAGKEGEHLSWQRLQALPDAFFLELLILLAEHRGIARVRMQIELERKVGA